MEFQGVTGRFDDVIGRGWTVVGLDSDPREVLDPVQLAQLELIGATLTRIDSAPGAGGVVDTEGTYTRWLKEAGVTYLITRPDFYVYATAVDGTELKRYVQDLGDRLHLNPQPVPVN